MLFNHQTVHSALDFGLEVAICDRDGNHVGTLYRGKLRECPDLVTKPTSNPDFILVESLTEDGLCWLQMMDGDL